MGLNLSKEFSAKLAGKILELKGALDQLDSIFFKISNEVLRDHTKEINHRNKLSNSFKEIIHD